MSRHADLSPIGQRIAAIVERHALDLRYTYMADAAEGAAVRVLADDEIAAGLRALPVLAALDARHQPRTWVGGHTVVCAACETAWPCRDRELLDGATETPAAGGCGGSTPPAAGHQPHQPDWDGNRCANCNTRLADAGPWCDAGAGLPTDEMAAVTA